jgi:hypothetical protein
LPEGKAWELKPDAIARTKQHSRLGPIGALRGHTQEGQAVDQAAVVVEVDLAFLRRKSRKSLFLSLPTRPV